MSASAFAQDKRIFKIYVLGNHMEANKPRLEVNKQVRTSTLLPSFLDTLEYHEVELRYGKNVLEFTSQTGYDYSNFVDTLEIDDSTPEYIYYLNSNTIRTCEAIVVSKSEIRNYRKNKRKLRRLKRLAFINKILLIEIGNFNIEIQ